MITNLISPTCIYAAVNKASNMLGLVKATFTCLDEVTVPRLFISIGKTPTLSMETSSGPRALRWTA